MADTENLKSIKIFVGDEYIKEVYTVMRKGNPAFELDFEASADTFMKRYQPRLIELGYYLKGVVIDNAKTKHFSVCLDRWGDGFWTPLRFDRRIIDAFGEPEVLKICSASTFGLSSIRKKNENL